MRTSCCCWTTTTTTTTTSSPAARRLRGRRGAGPRLLGEARALSLSLSLAASSARPRARHAAPRREGRRGIRRSRSGELRGPRGCSGGANPTKARARASERASEEEGRARGAPERAKRAAAAGAEAAAARARRGRRTCTLARSTQITKSDADALARAKSSKRRGPPRAAPHSGAPCARSTASHAARPLWMAIASGVRLPITALVLRARADAAPGAAQSSAMTAG